MTRSGWSDRWRRQPRARKSRALGRQYSIGTVKWPTDIIATGAVGAEKLHDAQTRRATDR